MICVIFQLQAELILRACITTQSDSILHVYYYRDYNFYFTNVMFILVSGKTEIYIIYKNQRINELRTILMIFTEIRM